MSIWRRIKYWLSGHGNNSLDIEDAMRGSDWTELDTYPCEANAIRVHPDRLDFSDTETPALYRKD